MAEVSSSPVAANNANASKRKEDVEIIKSRLSDQGFSMSRYADPLIPREGADARFWPKDVTLESEERWLAMIRASK